MWSIWIMYVLYFKHKWKQRKLTLKWKLITSLKVINSQQKNQFSRNLMILNPSWLLNHQIIEVNDTVFRIHHVNRLCQVYVHTPTYAHTDTHIQSNMINVTWLSDSSFVSLPILISFTHRHQQSCTKIAYSC